MANRESNLPEKSIKMEANPTSDPNGSKTGTASDSSTSFMANFHQNEADQKSKLENSSPHKPHKWGRSQPWTEMGLKLKLQQTHKQDSTESKGQGIPPLVLIQKETIPVFIRSN